MSLWKRFRSRFLWASHHDLEQTERRIMEELIKTAQAMTDASKSAALVLKDLHDRLVAAQNDPVALAKVIADLKGSTGDLVAAIVANTPAA